MSRAEESKYTNCLAPLTGESSMTTKKEIRNEDYLPFVPFFVKILSEREFAAMFEEAIHANDAKRAEYLIRSSGVEIKGELFSEEEHKRREAAGAHRLGRCFKIPPSPMYWCV